MKKIDLPENIRKAADENGYGYIHAKALLFLEMGAVKYRKKDAFGKPDKELNPIELEQLMNGCRQVTEYTGLTGETAFVDLGIHGFYILMELFHFEVCGQEVTEDGGSWLLDKMQVSHVMTGDRMVLYNRVEKEFLDD